VSCARAVWSQAAAIPLAFRLRNHR
jgi:hypothetical protein